MCWSARAEAPARPAECQSDDHGWLRGLLEMHCRVINVAMI